MRAETQTIKGVTQLLLSATGEKDIALLTELFNVQGSKKSLRQRARVRRVQRGRGGAVGFVVIDNDAYLTHTYMRTLGFRSVSNVVYLRERGFRLGGYYFVKGRYLIYNRLNSNVYRIYSNAKLKSYLRMVNIDDIRGNDRLAGLVTYINDTPYLAEQTVTQVHYNEYNNNGERAEEKIKQYVKVKRVSELNEHINITGE